MGESREKLDMDDGLQGEPDKPRAEPATDETLEFQVDDSQTDRGSKSDGGSLTVDTEDAQPEGSIIGEYAILGKIGAGGGGQVYKAEHQRMERIVALKVLPKSTPKAVKRFHQEVKAAAKLIHPNIVTAFDAGEHEGMPYLVMEYVEGKSLDQVVDDGGPLQVDTACDFIAQAARGLAYAHSRTIVHRDIKPSNLMLDNEGAVKVLDMGLARYAASSSGAGKKDDTDSGELTKAGTVIGTVNYMSPEQTRDAKSVDHRTDIYSLGCTFYYLLTAQSVFSGDMIAVLLAHTQQPIPSLRNFREDVPERLDAVYQRMLAKRPEDRYQAISEVVADLEEFIIAGPIGAAGAAAQLTAEITTDSPWAAKLQETLRASHETTATVVGKALAVGIDLGTTVSSIARIDKKTGKPATLANSEGQLATPSVVMIDGSTVAIGKDALDAVGTKAECLAERIKRDLGRNSYHSALSGQHYPPEVLQALIINKLVKDVGQEIGEFNQVAIAVPAYFGDVRRKAVEDAAYIAGLELLDIINEPTAAAVAFAQQHEFFESAKGESSQRLLVCDVGGGAFDVSLIQAQAAKFSVLATGGAFVLGGHDWDGRLAGKVAKLFTEKYGLDPRLEPNAAGLLWRECEDARCALSDHDKATINFEFEGNPARVTVSRQQLKSFTRDIIEGIQTAIEKTLQMAEVEAANIDHVLLAGGMSHTPMIRDMLKKLTGKEPDASISVDQAVAHGAALYAAARLAKKEGRPPRFEIEEVNSHSMGIVATDKKGGKRHAILIPRNTRLPASAKRTFKTHKQGQDSLTIQIVQGESKSLKECTWIGKCVIENLPPGLPAGTPFSVEFRCTSNGRLTVFVESPVTGQRVTQEIRRPTRLSGSELEHWREWVETMALCAGFEGEGF